MQSTNVTQNDQIGRWRSEYSKTLHDEFKRNEDTFYVADYDENTSGNVYAVHCNKSRANMPDSFQDVWAYERSGEGREFSEYELAYNANAMAESRMKPFVHQSSLTPFGEMDLRSGYKEEFQNIPRRCAAGELVESVKEHQDETEHFKFKQVKHGHLFYVPRQEERLEAKKKEIVEILEEEIRKEEREIDEV
ncbi:hypothetical protein L596_004070 [Steinernema carpocapsae]|uniref:Uncharacterized protein n=1 Tax=Steinernema carpocapsae TaxID=34508 RepID=A0A4U8UUR1_STECR|nr:hypothetical protein L596_004070 [Steinernema carpocapsae]